MDKNQQTERLERVEEQLAIAKREVERGRVVIRTHIEERDELAEIALHNDEAIIECVVIGRPVELRQLYMKRMVF